MGFAGLVIANNFGEIVGGICFLIVAAVVFLWLGRKLERQRMRKMGMANWQAYLDDPKGWLHTYKNTNRR